MLAQAGHQLAKLVVAEEGRCAAAEVQLLDHLIGIEVTADQLHLAQQALQVGRAAPAVLGDDLVAGAVVADVRAERQVHVQRQSTLGLGAGAQGVQQVEGADAVVELHGGGIGGVAWPGQIVAADQVGIPADGVEHADVPDYQTCVAV
ncbi:hypothetical protein D9M71_386220 [compost metagenome]